MRQFNGALWNYNESCFFDSGKPFGLLGILNITPDSFYDGGIYLDVEQACAQAGKLLNGGATIIDIGAESTRPGASEIGYAEELKRLLPVVIKIRQTFPRAHISIDTWRAATARACLEQGCVCINDVSGTGWDPDLIEIVAHYKPAYVLMHSQGKPEVMQKNPTYENIVDEVHNFFEQKILELCKAGLPENRICLDPGIGFGKTINHNLQLIENLHRFLDLGRPVLIGLSMKGFLGKITGCPIGSRSLPTAVASVIAWQNGAFWHRVHEPEAVGASLNLASVLSKN